MQYSDFTTNSRQPISGGSLTGTSKGRAGKGTLVEPYSLPILSAIPLHTYKENSQVECNYDVDNNVVLQLNHQDLGSQQDQNKYRCTVELVEDEKQTTKKDAKNKVVEKKSTSTAVVDSESERRRQFQSSRYPWKIALLDHNRQSNIDALHCFQNLTKLDLSYNKQVSLPTLSFWSNFPKLQVQYQHHNKLDSISDLKNLESLLKLVALSVYGNPVECHPDYRHMLCNLLPNQCLLDFHIISDAELVTDMTYDLDKAPLSTTYECVQPQVNSRSVAEHTKQFKFEVSTAQYLRSEQSSIIRIQCWWRGIRVRRTIRELHKAARTLQLAWKRWRQKREAAMQSTGYDVSSVALTGENTDRVKLQENDRFYKEKAKVTPLSSSLVGSAFVVSELNSPHLKRQKDRLIQLVDATELENSRGNVLVLLTRTRTEEKLWEMFGCIKVDDMIIRPPIDIMDLELRVMRDMHVYITNSPRAVITLEIHGTVFKIARKPIGEGALHTVFSIIDSDQVLKLNKPYSLAIEKLLKEQDRLHQIQRISENERIRVAKVIEIDTFGMYMICERIHGSSAVDHLLSLGLLERVGHNGVKAVSPDVLPVLLDLPDVQSFRQEIQRLMGFKQRYPGVIGDQCPTNIRVEHNNQLVVVGSSQILTKQKATYAYAAQRGFLGYLQYAATSVGKLISARVYTQTYEAKGTRMFVSDVNMGADNIKTHYLLANNQRPPRVQALPSILDIRNRSLYVVADSAKTLLSLALVIRHVQQLHGVAAAPLCVSGYCILSVPSHTDDFPYIKVQRTVHGDSLPKTYPRLLHGPQCPGNAKKALQVIKPRGLTVPHVDRLRKEIASALSVAHKQQVASYNVQFSNSLQFPQPPPTSHAIDSVNTYQRQNLKNRSSYSQDAEYVPNEDNIQEFNDYMRPGESLVYFRDRLVRAAKTASPVHTQLLLLVCPSLPFLRDIVEQVHVHNFGGNKEQETPIYVYPHVTVRVMSAVLLIQSSWRAYLSRKRSKFPTGALVAIRRAQVCISRWWKVQQYKRRIFMLRGLMRYGMQIQDHILFMRSDVYHQLNSCPNDFVKKGIFPEHRVLVDVAIRTSKQRDAQKEPQSAEQEMGLNELGDQVVMKTGISEIKRVARSSLAVYSLPQVDYKTAPFSLHPSKAFQHRNDMLSPNSASLGSVDRISNTGRINQDNSGLQAIQETRHVKQVNGKQYMQEHSIYVEPDEQKHTREMENKEKTNYRFLPIPGWLQKSCGIHGMWLEQGPRQLYDYGEHSDEEEDDGWSEETQSKQKQKLKKAVRKTVEKLQDSNWAALTSAESKVLKPWHYTLKDRLLNVQSVGVTVEVVPDASQLLRNEVSEISGNFTDMKQYWIKLTFSSIQEARLRAMYLAMMTWDPVAHQSVALLLTAQKISQINQAYELFQQAKPVEPVTNGVWTGGIEERLTILQVLWYKKAIIQSDYINLIPPTQFLAENQDMTQIIQPADSNHQPTSNDGNSSNYTNTQNNPQDNKLQIYGEGVGSYPEHILKYASVTGVTTMSSEEQKLLALKHSQENKQVYAQGQKLISTLLQAQKTADVQSDLLASKKRNYDQRVHHDMKVQQIEQRKAQVRTVRHQEVEEMKVYLATAKATFEAQRIGEAIKKKEERMRNRETYDVEKRIMQRDLRRNVMRQKEEDLRVLEEHRDMREKQLFEQKQQRKQDKSQRDQNQIERETANQFVAKQNMVLRQLQRGLLLRTKEVHQDRQNTHTQLVQEQQYLGKEKCAEKDESWKLQLRQTKEAHNFAVQEALKAREHVNMERIQALQAKREHDTAIRQGIGLSKDLLLQLPTPSMSILRQQGLQQHSQPLQLPPINNIHTKRKKATTPVFTNPTSSIKPAPLLDTSRDQTATTATTNSYVPIDYKEKSKQLAKQQQEQDIQSQPTEVNIAAQTKAIDELSQLVAERMNRLKTQR